mmetsp:Transcript_36894/g.104123  ORF Transcript_36894/g.104123 Transcript_36894/m.104123 type:complete len:245 (+) Transcript_36894:48-782(+)
MQSYFPQGVLQRCSQPPVSLSQHSFTDLSPPLSPAFCESSACAGSLQKGKLPQPGSWRDALPRGGSCRREWCRVHTLACAVVARLSGGAACCSPHQGWTLNGSEGPVQKVYGRAKGWIRLPASHCWLRVAEGGRTAQVKTSRMKRAPSRLTSRWVSSGSNSLTTCGSRGTSSCASNDTVRGSLPADSLTLRDSTKARNFSTLASTTASSWLMVGERLTKGRDAPGSSIGTMALSSPRERITVRI